MEIVNHCHTASVQFCKNTLNKYSFEVDPLACTRRRINGTERPWLYGASDYKFMDRIQCHCLDYMVIWTCDIHHPEETFTHFSFPERFINRCQQILISFDFQFLQKDVFLICSNAMQYNEPDTIYFRQVWPHFL